MPILQHYKDQSGGYVRTAIKSAIITYQLTAQGLQQLRAHGIIPGKNFSRTLLLALIQTGDAYTGRTGAGFLPDGFAAKDDQAELPLMDLFPRCASCGGFADLSLVVAAQAGERFTCALLCQEEKCRPFSTTIHACFPLPMVDRKALGELRRRFTPLTEDSTVVRHSELLERDFAKEWDARAPKRSEQTSFTGIVPNDSDLFQ